MREEINKALEVLKNGGVILYPTDTVWGLGCDATNAEAVAKINEIKGRVPARSVLIPGSYTKQFPAGEYQVPCALIIGQRKESIDKKTSLNDALRENNVSV